MLKNNPPKPFWRGKLVQITIRKPAKTTLAGKNIRGNHKIPHQNPFSGETRHELDPQTRQNIPPNQKKEAASCRGSLLFLVLGSDYLQILFREIISQQFP
jgi:hypothetical protein